MYFGLELENVLFRSHLNHRKWKIVTETNHKALPRKSKIQILGVIVKKK